MYKHLFVPVDGSELSHRAMDGSIELALQLGARITGFVVEPDVLIADATTPTGNLLDRDFVPVPVQRVIADNLIASNDMKN